VVVTHWNKTGEGTDHRRISGAGPSAWGRVLASAAVAYRGTTPEGVSAVVLGFHLVGGEIPDTRFRVRRTVRALDPVDLASPLEYAAEVLPDDESTDQGEVPLGADGQPLKPSRRWVLAALEAGGELQTVSSSATIWPPRATRSSPAPSRRPWPTWRPLAWPAAPRPPRGSAATGHPPAQPLIPPAWRPYRDPAGECGANRARCAPRGPRRERARETARAARAYV
jgi:hypothetical protein